MGKLIYLKCKWCKRSIYKDMEQDWVHLHPKYRDWRYCDNPAFNIVSEQHIAEPNIEWLYWQVIKHDNMTKTISIAISQETIDKINEEAVAQNRSRSNLIETIILKYLKEKEQMINKAK